MGRGWGEWWNNDNNENDTNENDTNCNEKNDNNDNDNDILIFFFFFFQGRDKQGTSSTTFVEFSILFIYFPTINLINIFHSCKDLNKRTLQSLWEEIDLILPKNPIILPFFGFVCFVCFVRLFCLFCLFILFVLFVCFI